MGLFPPLAGIYSISFPGSQASGLRLELHHWLSEDSSLQMVDCETSQPSCHEPVPHNKSPFISYWLCLSGEPRLIQEVTLSPGGNLFCQLPTCILIDISTFFGYLIIFWDHRAVGKRRKTKRDILGGGKSSCKARFPGGFRKGLQI